MPSRTADPEGLRQLLGLRVTYRQQEWLVIDLLPDGPELVLERPGERVIQGDQHGDGRRRVSPTATVAVFDDDGSPSSEFLALDFLRR